MKTFLLALCGLPLWVGAVRPAYAPTAQSAWVRVGNDGKLTYQTTPRGDRILDFSTAGYGGGGERIPEVPSVQTVSSPSGSDDTAMIQAALDAVSKRTPQEGFRGAVVLARGTYHCNRPLTLRASGVVLRGSGSGSDGTILRLDGSPHAGLVIGGEAAATKAGPSIAITDAYVPSGANAVHVADATALHESDTINICHPVTPSWTAFMGMDKLVRNDKPQTWLSGEIRTERTVQAIHGNEIVLNLPLSDSLDARYLSPPGASLNRTASPARLAQIGVEKLRIEAPSQTVTINDPHYQAIRLNAVEDGWLRDIAIANTVDSVSISSSCRRITAERVTIRHEVPTTGAAKPADFSLSGSQILLDRCDVTGANVFYVVTGARVTGPNVVLNSVFHGSGWIQPHQRWATGLLLDGCQVPNGGIELMNRGIMGSGHGWTIGWSVAWNCTAKSLMVQQPPGAINWAIGCRGPQERGAMPGTKTPLLPEGVYDSPNVPVAPRSLYLAQLRERRGPGALSAIGYTSPP